MSRLCQQRCSKFDKRRREVRAIGWHQRQKGLFDFSAHFRSAVLDGDNVLCWIKLELKQLSLVTRL